MSQFIFMHLKYSDEENVKNLGEYATQLTWGKILVGNFFKLFTLTKREKSKQENKITFDLGRIISLVGLSLLSTYYYNSHKLDNWFTYIVNLRSTLPY